MVSTAQVDALVRGAYRPHRDLPAVLSGLACALMAQLPVQHGSLEVSGVGRLSFHGEPAGGIGTRWHDAAWEQGWLPLEGHPQPATGVQTAFTAHYAGMPIGELTLGWHAQAEGGAQHADGVAHFAKRCAYLAHRYRVQAWSRRQLRRASLLVGISQPLHALECFIERAAGSDLPVLLHGEFGTEKAWAAAAIHVGSRRSAGPVVEVHCADPAGEPAQWLASAQGGTLFLNGIDELSPRLQTQLHRHLQHLCPTHLGEATEANGARIIASATADLSRLGAEAGFSRALLAELDFLGAELPPLRVREDDMEALISATLERHGFSAPQRCSAELLQACRGYDWPENVSELERTIARLAVMTDSPAIGHAEVLQHAPWLTGGHRSVVPVGPVEPTAAQPAQAGSQPAAAALRPSPATASSRPTAAPRTAAQWVQVVLERQTRVLDTVHAGLRRALVFLAEHHAEPIALGELAEQAHVSASHLSYLFRSTLGLSFKSFLLSIRIHVAQQLLLLEPQLRITEVALRAGFADLSHFERCFRRAIGQSAREHRRAHLGAA